MLRFVAGDGSNAYPPSPPDTSATFAMSDASLLHFRPLDSRANLFAD
jgi:hypothetical protein